MNDLLVRMLLTIAVYWGASFAMGMVSGPAWGFTLGSIALLYLLAVQMSKLDPVSESAVPASGVPFGPAPLGAPQIPEAPKADAAGSVAAASCGIGVLDREFRLFWCNDALADHFGAQRAKNVIGEPAGKLVPGDPSLADYLAAGRFAEALRLELARPGRPVLSLRVVPYIGTQWLLLSLDITDADRLEVKRKDCMDNALHELRAPMMVLSWSLDVMRERAPEDPSVRERLTAMTEQCRRMRQITEDLRNLSALETAPEPPGDERVGVATLLRVVQAEAEALSIGRQRVTLAAEPGFDLLGSRVELASAFSNLAGNAVRYTPQGGEIRLRWHASAAGAEFVVEDTGIGIAKEHLPRLTERFYQADRSFSRKYGGVGLGLAIVKDVLDRHQATLEIASEPGKGSRFTARFPAHRVTAEPRSAAPQRENREDATAAAPGATMLLSPHKVPMPAAREERGLVMPMPQPMPDRACA
jgi:two-component system phosphate regulon sensor histidine kinase PhoR